MVGVGPLGRARARTMGRLKQFIGQVLGFDGFRVKALVLGKPPRSSTPSKATKPLLMPCSPTTCFRSSSVPTLRSTSCLVKRSSGQGQRCVPSAVDSAGCTYGPGKTVRSSRRQIASGFWQAATGVPAPDRSSMNYVVCWEPLTG
jgi:hypothetical protein